MNHINFDDEGLIISNLQLFLKQNYRRDLSLSGVYDIDTHKALIGYLKQPNTLSSREMKEKLIAKFTYKEVLPPHSLVDGGGIFNFDNQVTDDTIMFYTKPTNTCFDNGVSFINAHIEELSEYISDYGWSVESYSRFVNDYAGTQRTRAEIHLKKTGIVNILPNKEVLPMVNLYDGQCLYNKCFLDNDGKFQGVIQPSDNYKIAIVECSPGDEFTIAHGFSSPCELAFAYSEYSLQEIKYNSNNKFISVIADYTDNSLNGPVYPSVSKVCKIPEDSKARYLLIQMPFTNKLTTRSTQKITVNLGDINQDGKIDSTDVTLLNSWVSANENNQPQPFQLSGNALIAANISRDIDADGNPIVDRTDVTLLQQAVESGKTSLLGSVGFEQVVTASAYSQDRLLIMYGAFTANDSYNAPLDQFWIEPWAVHEKFLQYFLGRVIHKYSDIEDISWLQTNVRNYFGDYTYKYTGTYDSEDDYATLDYVSYDNKTDKYKVYHNGLYLGYYLQYSNKDKGNGVFTNDDGSQTMFTLINNTLYKNNVSTGKILTESGIFANGNATRSLKSIIKQFQLDCNRIYNEAAEDAADSLKWTLGYYDVDTDKRFIRLLDEDETPITGAFR